MECPGIPFSPFNNLLEFPDIDFLRDACSLHDDLQFSAESDKTVTEDLDVNLPVSAPTLESDNIPVSYLNVDVSKLQQLQKPEPQSNNGQKHFVLIKNEQEVNTVTIIKSPEGFYAQTISTTPELVSSPTPSGFEGAPLSPSVLICPDEVS